MNATTKQTTIFALSTPYGSSGVAIVRLSGSKSLSILEALSGKLNFKSRYATFFKLYDPVSHETIDHCVALYFEGPNSYTGEDCVEIQCHGSPAVIDQLLNVLSKLDGCRQAEAGEFTRRAFENDKMDLTEAEAVADLVHAQTQLQKDQALSQLEGSLGILYQDWASELVGALAYFEASIDFADEELPDNILKPVLEKLKILHEDIGLHLNDNRRGEILREGLRIALVGAPNAGKSTLMNALMKRDIALISDVAGTTRDVLEGHLDVGGIPVILSDTAGLRPEELSDSGQDLIEKEGIKLALERAQSADIKILVFDATINLSKQHHALQLIDENSILVMNKADNANIEVDEDIYILVSAKNGENLDALLGTIELRARAIIGTKGSVSLTRKRHRDVLTEARNALGEALNGKQADLVAEDVRVALRSIGKITGRVDVEGLLDIIFSDFCIGK